MEYPCIVESSSSRKLRGSNNKSKQYIYTTSNYSPQKDCGGSRSANKGKFFIFYFILFFWGGGGLGYEQ